MKCNRCGHEISEGNSYEYLGRMLCEDCYIYIRYPARGCDPWAVYTATKSREIQGLKGTEGLTGQQKAIYEFIKGNENVSRERLIEFFKSNEEEIQRHLAILRHCELVKGRKEGNSTYMVPFDYDEQDVDSIRREENAQSK